MIKEFSICAPVHSVWFRAILLTKRLSFTSKAKAVLPHAKWQKAALGFAIAAFSTFIINLTFIIWATSSRSKDTKDGIGILLLPDTCSETKAFNTGIHVVVNILSTVLLSGSNYCMQCLMAPTRSEINEAHAKQEWMDIGVPSVRNFWRIRWKRRVFWLLFMISSLPLHLLYCNSVPTLLLFKLTSLQL
ncbi:hypothetical protein CGCSCA4_v000055 [Colletotrichum siamense]|uniref:DUF6536 domain-containing protein n=1 Tax=Colletotrichum siamense TaxID=690259 RepID=A0A9P5EY79_COLSI|nr:hypothetical protein CGCSCA4_v000055 [Colletotrichum siamense]KAF4862182.1 hypothetical protein CGCSCA2_v003873 [Colletotrichum siamense]